MPLLVFKLFFIGQFLPLAPAAKFAIPAFSMGAQFRGFYQFNQLSLGPGFFLSAYLDKHNIAGDTPIDKHRESVRFCKPFAAKGKVDDLKLICFSFFYYHIVFILL